MIKATDMYVPHKFSTFADSKNKSKKLFFGTQLADNY